MLTQYKKTFWATQALIAFAAFEGFQFTRNAWVALTFAVVMQASALFGAVWGDTLRQRIQRSA